MERAQEAAAARPGAAASGRSAANGGARRIHLWRTPGGPIAQVGRGAAREQLEQRRRPHYRHWRDAEGGVAGGAQGLSQGGRLRPQLEGARV